MSANLPASSASSSAAPAPAQAGSTNARQAQLVIPSSATPSQATIAVTLTQQPPPALNLWESGTVWVAGCALLGVLVTVAAAHIRMRSELDAAARRASDERELTREQARLDREDAAIEAHKERVTTTRREVYLESAVALGKAQNFLGAMANHDFEKLDYAENVGPLAVAINKISVVGELETVRAARELFKSYNEMLATAMGDLLPLAQIKNERKYHSGEYAAAQVEIKRLLAAMQSHNESPAHDRADFATLTSSFELQQARAYTENAEVMSRHEKAILEQSKYHSFNLESAKELGLKLDLLADCVRREMGIATDLAAFSAQTTEMWESARDAHRRLMAKVVAFQEDVARKNADKP